MLATLLFLNCSMSSFMLQCNVDYEFKLIEKTTLFFAVHAFYKTVKSRYFSCTMHILLVFLLGSYFKIFQQEEIPTTDNTGKKYECAKVF